MCTWVNICSFLVVSLSWGLFVGVGVLPVVVIICIVVLCGFGGIRCGHFASFGC